MEVGDKHAIEVVKEPGIRSGRPSAEEPEDPRAQDGVGDQAVAGILDQRGCVPDVGQASLIAEIRAGAGLAV